MQNFNNNADRNNDRNQDRNKPDFAPNTEEERGENYRDDRDLGNNPMDPENPMKNPDQSRRLPGQDGELGDPIAPNPGYTDPDDPETFPQEPNAPMDPVDPPVPPLKGTYPGMNDQDNRPRNPEAPVRDGQTPPIGE